MNFARQTAATLALSMLATGCAPDAVTPPGSDQTDDAVTVVPLPAGSVWASPEACLAAVRAGRRMTRSIRDGVRVAAWNVHWFPDGVAPGQGPIRHPTDLAWLACSLAWLDADVIALEELLTHTRGREALDEVVRRLSALTGLPWRASVSPCAQWDLQHQGFLYNSARVTARSLRNFDWVTGRTSAEARCDITERPAYMGYFSVRGGADFHLGALHLKSGVDARSFGLRARARGLFDAVAADARAAVRDDDLLLVGDFNTMGCTADDCRPWVDSEEEVAAQAAAVQPRGFRQLAASQACTEYDGETGHVLDHVVASRSAREVPSRAAVTVGGYCAELRCAALPSRSTTRVQRDVSDHCPVLVELDGRDLD